MPKNKLKSGFDPIWSSEFLDLKLKKMSRTAFIIRQMYRSYRNPENNICILSDLQIHKITGWGRPVIQRARQQLIALGEIIPTGYHSFAIKTFHQYQESCNETLQSQKDKLQQNVTTSCNETLHELQQNITTGCNKTLQLQSPSDNTDTDIQIEKSDKSSVNNPVDKVCKDCANYLKDNIDSRGNKVGYCVTLKITLPPFTNAGACEYFHNLFAAKEVRDGHS